MGKETHTHTHKIGGIRKRRHENKADGDFPGSPVAKTPCSQCRGPGFDPWPGNQMPHATTRDPACCNED